MVLPLNKLVDMHAFGNPNVFGRNNSQESLGSEEANADAEVDHVARNAFVSSKYKHISGIRT